MQKIQATDTFLSVETIPTRSVANLTLTVLTCGLWLPIWLIQIATPSKYAIVIDRAGKTQKRRL